MLADRLLEKICSADHARRVLGHRDRSHIACRLIVALIAITMTHHGLLLPLTTLVYPSISPIHRQVEASQRHTLSQLINYHLIPIHQSKRKHSNNKMNLSSVAILAAVVFMATSISSSSALLFSPLLLKANPWGVVVAGTRAASSPTTTRSEKSIARPSPSPLLPDFSHDDDLMRYKHELLADIYEKSLHRGFVGNHQGH